MNGNATTDELFSAEPEKRLANLLAQGLALTSRALDIDDPDTNDDDSGLLWFHALAIGHSPTYLTENAGALRQDWAACAAAKRRHYTSCGSCARVAHRRAP